MPGAGGRRGREEQRGEEGGAGGAEGFREERGGQGGAGGAGAPASRLLHLQACLLALPSVLSGPG